MPTWAILAELDLMQSERLHDEDDEPDDDHASEHGADWDETGETERQTSRGE